MANDDLSPFTALQDWLAGLEDLSRSALDETAQDLPQSADAALSFDEKGAKTRQQRASRRQGYGSSSLGRTSSGGTRTTRVLPTVFHLRKPHAFHAKTMHKPHHFHPHIGEPRSNGYGTGRTRSTSASSTRESAASAAQAQLAERFLAALTQAIQQSLNHQGLSS